MGTTTIPIMRVALAWVLLTCTMTACAPQRPKSTATQPESASSDAASSPVDAADGLQDAVSDVGDATLPGETDATVTKDSTATDSAANDSAANDSAANDSAANDSAANDSAPKDSAAKDVTTDSHLDAGPTCPTAVITVVEGALVVPLTQLHLRGDKSLPAGGVLITKYLWTAKRPFGSTQVFAPSATFPNPVFDANVAGKYTFCLSVWDDLGRKSCQPTCSTVLAISSAELYIDLTWDTPADPNQSDTGPAAGTDLDLHFASAQATGPDIDCDGQPDPWFNNPYDTFWFNPQPIWNTGAAKPKSQPSLDRDDTDGSGPESLRLITPKGSLTAPTTYAIGVHYWNAHSFGVSTPTIHIFILGVLVASLKGPQMKTLDFWYVGKINWPNSLSNTASPLSPFELCYQTGQPCDTSNPGKMWTKTGNLCVRPCYINPAFTGTASGANLASCVTP